MAPAEYTDDDTVAFVETVSGSPVREPLVQALRRYQNQPAVEHTIVTNAERYSCRAKSTARHATRTEIKNALVSSPAKSRIPSITASRFDRESRRRNNTRNTPAASGTTTASFEMRATSG